MSIGHTTPLQEPRLTVRRRAVPFYQRWRFVLSFGTSLLAALTGLTLLLPSGNLLLPFEPTIILEGKMASKGDFFEDEEVKRILMANRIRVHVTRTGSREAAIHDIDLFDFAFPSGQPAADLIIKSRNSAVPPKFTKIYRPFTTPIVLATFREYAETLRETGIATAQSSPGFDRPLYYRLDLAKFLTLVEKGASWNSLNIQKHQVSNGNAVLAQSPNICSANSAGTYMGLVAFVRNGNKVVTSMPEATRVASEIKPLVTAQGLPTPDLFRTYQTPEGKGAAPIVVVYEHQFLAYQVKQRADSGTVDLSRVLLYPSTNFLTQPEFIALNPKGDRLGQLMVESPALRRRALELGFRVLAPNSVTDSLALAAYLEASQVPVPSSGNDDTKAVLPELALFEEMIQVTGGCPPP